MTGKKSSHENSDEWNARRAKNARKMELRYVEEPCALPLSGKKQKVISPTLVCSCASPRADPTEQQDGRKGPFRMIIQLI